MANEQQDWVTIVEPIEEDSAASLFANWRRENASWAELLTPEDVRIDVIRASEGRTLYRYRVRAMGSPL